MSGDLPPPIGDRVTSNFITIILSVVYLRFNPEWSGYLGLALIFVVSFLLAMVGPVVEMYKKERDK